MKLEEEMYVRTDKGKIGKIVDVILVDGRKRYILDSSNALFYLKEEIVKSSHNIIDLIKEKDLISYRISGDLYVSEVQEHPEFREWKLHIEFVDTIINLEDLDIISILTKEQFESMSYKVGK